MLLCYLIWAAILGHRPARSWSDKRHSTSLQDASIRGSDWFTLAEPHLAITCAFPSTPNLLFNAKSGDYCRPEIPSFRPSFVPFERPARAKVLPVLCLSSTLHRHAESAQTRTAGYRSFRLHARGYGSTIKGSSMCRTICNQLRRLAKTGPAPC